MVLHFVADDADPWGLAARYAGALTPGSCLALSHITYEGLPPRLVEEGVNVYAQAQGVYPRSRAQIERFFAGLQVVPPYPGAEPAITHIGVWGPTTPNWPTATVPTGGTAGSPAARNHAVEAACRQWAATARTVDAAASAK
jgi:hypothetical protein